MRGVGDVGDRTLVDQFQTVHDVLRRRSDLDFAYDAGGVTRAAFGVFDLDLEIRSWLRAEQFGSDRHQVEIVDGRDLAGDAVVVHGIDAVGGDLRLQPGLWHRRHRAEVAFNGDAADGKSSAILRSLAGGLIKSRIQLG